MDSTLRPQWIRVAAGLALPPALLCSVATAQADWCSLAPQSSAPVRPISAIAGAAGNVWSLSADGVRLTAADGSSRVVLRDTRFAYAQGQLLSDGGLLLHSGCQLQQLDAQGQPGWARNAEPGETCAGFAAQRSGESWLAQSRHLLAYDKRGLQVASAHSSDAGLEYGALAIGANGDAIAARNGSDLVAARPAVLSRYDRSGRELWSWTSTAAATLHHVRVTDTGDILAELRARDAIVPILQRWNGGGTLLWSLPLGMVGEPHTVAVLPAAAGEAYVLNGRIDASTRASQLLRVASDGHVRWSWRIDCSDFTPAQVVADGNDGLALLCLQQTSATLLRWDARGVRVGTVELALVGGSAGALERLSDGSLLAIGSDRADPARRRSLRIGTDDRVSLHALDSLHEAAPIELIAQHLASDGSSYVATQRRRQNAANSYSLTRFSADGSRTWTLSRPYALDTVHPSKIAAAADRVCIAESKPDAAASLAPALQCFSSADGRLLWSAALPAGSAPQSLTLLDSGEAVVVHTLDLTPHTSWLLSFAADGRQAARVETGITQQATTDRAGRTTVVGPEHITQYDRSGARIYQVAREPGLSLPSYAIVAGDDGRVWVSEGAESGENRVRALQPDGSTRWLAGSGYTPDPFASNVLIVGEEDIYLLQRLDSADGKNENFLMHIDAASGLSHWGRLLVDPLHPRQDTPYLAVMPSTGDVVLAQAWPDRLRLERFGSEDGNSLHLRTVAARSPGQPAPLHGRPQPITLDHNGTARLALNLLDDSAGLSTGVLAVDHIGTPPPPVRLDQPGIRGVWHSPYANGEGLVLDWISPQRTVFGGWFTYSSSGGNDPAQLRWYTIQADAVAANASMLEMPILESLGGNFDAGPGAFADRVGTATLQFIDCDNATLNYSFTVGQNAGAQGSLSLSRLAPATEPCIRADGTTRPAPGARPPQGGFDARMSGTWSDETRNGQGLQFTVQPGGVFFAPWFTYDPQGQGNDASREHWFTLQGNLATARNGTAEVLIAQSLGGAFDRVSTYNGFAVGKATITMTACDAAKVDYRFDDTDLAGAFRKRSGTLDLRKIGGCSP